MRRLMGPLALGLILGAADANADAYLYQAECKDSYSKQGKQSDDLTKKKGKPVRCDAVVFALLDNGRVSVQFADKKSKFTPLGFTGNGLDHELNPNFVSIPLDSISLPHESNPEVAQTVSGIEGYCFVNGAFNVRSLESFVCAAKMEIGEEKLVYHIEARAKGLGEKVPGM